MPATPKRKADTTALSPKSPKRVRINEEKEVNTTALTPRRSTRTKTVTKLKEPGQEAVVEELVATVKKTIPRKGKTQVKPEILEKVQEDSVKKNKPENKTAKTSQATKIIETGEVEELQTDGKKPTKQKQKRKTKEEKEAEMIPLATRSQGLKMFIGAHVSGAGGVHNSVINGNHIGANAFALFLKSQRKWDNPPLQEDHRNQFINLCKEHAFVSDKYILPHGSYLVNLAQKEADKAAQAYSSFIDDLKRCDALGIKLYNFHPGNTGPHPRSEAISRIASALNKAHKETKTVVPVLETMAGGGNAIGSTFEDLRDAIAGVDDKSRVGVCIDTCHIFAAGYDIRTPEAFKKTLDKFDKIVGIKYLKALHLNDSKAPFKSHRDLHQNIGLGFLGLRTFHNVMNEPRFEDLPMVLETPIDHKDANGKTVEDRNIWAKEIKMLESFIGMDADGAEFKKLEKELAARGAEERKKIQDQVDRKAEKDEKKAAGKGKGRKRKAAKSDEDGSGSE
ncbi:hypothetical protein MMC10_005399 [Thelotrema lepadinum]|nr:hypothetical protein [Thelotrema lepadinum]